MNLRFYENPAFNGRKGGECAYYCQNVLSQDVPLKRPIKPPIRALKSESRSSLIADRIREEVLKILDEWKSRGEQDWLNYNGMGDRREVLRRRRRKMALLAYLYRDAIQKSPDLTGLIRKISRRWYPIDTSNRDVAYALYNQISKLTPCRPWRLRYL